jgi:hypothetical protein
MIEAILWIGRIGAIGAIESGPNRALIDSIIPIRLIHGIASGNFLTYYSKTLGLETIEAFAQLSTQR